MNRFNHFRFLMTAVLTVSVLATGCSSTNPYQRSKQIDTPIKLLASQAETQGAEPLAGKLHGAAMVLKDQRREWYESLSTQAQVRAVTQYALLGLTAITVYSSLKSGVASASDKNRLAFAGGLGLAAYGASNWFINPNQERAYLDGIKSLTCAMSAIEPLRFDTPTFTLMKDEQKTLTAVINELDKSLLIEQSKFRYPKNHDSAPAQVRVEASQALKRARATLTSSFQLSTAIDNSGITLMREGDLVFSKVASDIRSANKDVDSPSELAIKAPSFLGKFNAIKIDVEEGKGGTPEVTDAPVPGSPDKAKSDPPKPSPATARGTPLITQASTEELQSQIDTLRQAESDKYEKSIAKAKLELKQIDKKVQDKQISSNALSLKYIVDACKKTGRSDCDPTSTADAMSTALATQTAALYAARRPLSNRLLDFKAASRAVAANKGCSGPGSPMTVSPSADANVAPGAVYPITISGVIAPPSVTVSGPATFDYSVGPNANQYTYKVLVGADAKGQIDIAISDRGLAVEEITLTVVEPKKP